MSRLAFVTNFCPHYRVRTFEVLARHHDVDYYFFSEGREWYWTRDHSIAEGRFHARYVPGFRIAGTRITPMLPLMLWRGRYDAYIKCVNGRFALPVTYAVARLTRRPFVLWTGVWMRLQTPVHRLLFPITRYVYRHADAVVAYGDHVRRFLEDEGVSTERIFVAPHAVDNASYNRAVEPHEFDAVNQTLAIDRNTRVIMYIGRLEDGKGLPTLLEAFASLDKKDVALVLAGSGSLRPQLEHLARQLGVESRVRFPGYIKPADTVAYYARAWLYVLPSVTTSRFKEPWGLVVNEAFNQGVPVVATDAVGAAAGGLIRDGINGYVVPEGNAAALSAAMRRVLDDAQLRSTLSGNARATIAEWDNERMVLGFRRALDYVLDGHRR